MLRLACAGPGEGAVGLQWTRLLNREGRTNGGRTSRRRRARHALVACLGFWVLLVKI
jgi:hypothetical protein